MKIAFLVGQQTENLGIINEILDHHQYVVVKTSTPDELVQAGNQATKIIVVFDDAKYAFKFCQENGLGGFATLRLIFLSRKPIMNAEVSRKLGSVGLQLFTAEDAETIHKKIVEFENYKEDVSDIEFSIIGDLENAPEIELPPIEASHEPFKKRVK